MNDKTAYDITAASKISLNKMNFDVVNLCPKYSQRDAQTAKTEIETKLFDIFIKYADEN